MYNRFKGWRRWPQRRRVTRSTRKKIFTTLLSDIFSLCTLVLHRFQKKISRRNGMLAHEKKSKRLRGRWDCCWFIGYALPARALESFMLKYISCNRVQLTDVKLPERLLHTYYQSSWVYLIEGWVSLITILVITGLLPLASGNEHELYEEPSEVSFQLSINRVDLTGVPCVVVSARRSLDRLKSRSQ